MYRRKKFDRVLLTHAIAVVGLLGTCRPSRAQSAPQLRLTTGVSVNFVMASGTGATYAPALLPYAALHYAAPLTPRIALLTGLSYQQKGFISRATVRSETDNDIDLYRNKTRYDFISIPLQISVQLISHRRVGLCFSGGMNYGFMIGAQIDGEMDTYRYGRLINHNDYSARPAIGLLPSENRLTASKFGIDAELYLFNPALAASLILAWHKRYLLSAFYEYNLYDASKESHQGTMRLQSAGLCIGIGF